MPAVGRPRPSTLFSATSVRRELRGLMVAKLGMTAKFASAAYGSGISFYTVFFYGQVMQVPPVASFAASGSLAVVSLRTIKVFGY